MAKKFDQCLQKNKPSMNDIQDLHLWGVGCMFLLLLNWGLQSKIQGPVKGTTTRFHINGFLITEKFSFLYVSCLNIYIVAAYTYNSIQRNEKKHQATKKNSGFKLKNTSGISCPFHFSSSHKKQERRESSQEMVSMQGKVSSRSMKRNSTKGSTGSSCQK